MARLKHDNFDCVMRHRTNCRGRTTKSSVTVTVTVMLHNLVGYVFDEEICILRIYHVFLQLLRPS